jgi:hypothetical protein
MKERPKPKEIIKKLARHCRGLFSRRHPNIHLQVLCTATPSWLRPAVVDATQPMQ